MKAESATTRIKTWKEEVGRRPDSATAHFNLGLAYTEKGMMTSAQKAYEKALELDPELFEAWVNLGGVMLLQWNFPAALEATRKAAEQHPDSVLAHYNMGQAHLYLGDAKAVVECNRRVLALDPHHAAAHYFLAVGLLSTDQVEEARAELSQATRLGHRPSPEFLRKLEKADNAKSEPVPVMEIGSGVNADGQTT